MDQVLLFGTDGSSRTDSCDTCFTDDFEALFLDAIKR